MRSPALPVVDGLVIINPVEVRLTAAAVPDIFGLDMEGAGIDSPEGSVALSDGTPEPFVTSTALLVVDNPTTTVPVPE